MTGTRTASTGTTDWRAAPTPRKAILICPECGHEAPLDGDWTVRDVADECRRRRIVSCPVCGTVIAEQPSFSKRSDDHESTVPLC